MIRNVIIIVTQQCEVAYIYNSGVYDVYHGEIFKGLPHTLDELIHDLKCLLLLTKGCDVHVKPFEFITTREGEQLKKIIEQYSI